MISRNSALLKQLALSETTTFGIPYLVTCGFKYPITIFGLISTLLAISNSNLLRASSVSLSTHRHQCIFFHMVYRVNPFSLWVLSDFELGFANTTHLLILSSTETFIPGQNMFSLARALHLTMPRCHSCMQSNISSLSAFGISSLFPFIKHIIYDRDFISVIPVHFYFI